MADKPTVFNYAKYEFAVQQVAELEAKLDALQKKYDALKESKMDHPIKTRADVLDAALRIVYGSREQDYGTPENNFASIAEFWTDYLDYTISAYDVGIMMCLFKIARLKSGTAKADSFVDLAGYAACTLEIASTDEEAGGNTHE